MRTCKRLLPLLLSLALAGQSLASGRAAKYEITPMYSNVGFSIMKFFIKEEGGFREYGGEIYYDPDHPERSWINMTVKAASIDTRIDNRDKALRSEDFFDVDHYPALGFKSVSVSAKPGGMLDVTGDLTIHGVTRRITIPVHFLGFRKEQGSSGEFAGFDTEFTIDRTAFGVSAARWSGGQLILSKEVTIHLAIGATKAGTR